MAEPNPLVEARKALARTLEEERGNSYPVVSLTGEEIRALLGETDVPAPAAPAAETTDLKAAIRSLVGEGLHTMLRKGFDGHGSAELWRFIAGLPDEVWIGMLDYWLVDPVMEELARRAPSPAPDEVREAAQALAEWDNEEVRRASPSVRRLVRALSALVARGGE